MQDAFNSRDVLKDTGILQAYSELIGDLMVQGNPEGDVFEYSARFMLEYQKRQATLREKAARNYPTEAVVEEEAEDSMVLSENKPKRRRTKLTLSTRQGITPLHQKIGPSLFELTDSKPRSLVMQIYREPLDYSALESDMQPRQTKPSRQTKEVDPGYVTEPSASIDDRKLSFGPEMHAEVSGQDEEDYDEEPQVPSV